MTDLVFDALGDGSRRRILQVLATGEQPAGAVGVALQAVQPISQPAVSQHLKVLLHAGLVTVRAEGTRRLYAIDPDGLDLAHAWLAGLTSATGPFDQALDALATEVARGQRANQPARAPARTKAVG